MAIATSISRRIEICVLALQNTNRTIFNQIVKSTQFKLNPNFIQNERMESQQTQTDLKFLLNTISIISAGLLYTNHIHSINVYKIVVN